MKKFWLVYDMKEHHAGSPRETLEEAEADAKRCAERNPGMEITILEAVRFAYADPPSAITSLILSAEDAP